MQSNAMQSIDQLNFDVVNVKDDTIMQKSSVDHCIDYYSGRRQDSLCFFVRVRRERNWKAEIKRFYRAGTLYGNFMHSMVVTGGIQYRSHFIALELPYNNLITARPVYT